MADFKILALQNLKFKNLAFIVISAFQNPQFKIMADFKIFFSKMLNSRF